MKTEMHSLPTELDQVNREIIHVETERAALLNETDDKSKQRLKTIEEDLTTLKSKQAVQSKE
ncbi:hypothetical protein FACS1894218_3600 [Bacilli bacterium]|nr:hypothetical protein FACS1894218_3600 [Bacilli bacterium]